jgi:hypothetical protein
VLVSQGVAYEEYTLVLMLLQIGYRIKRLQMQESLYRPLLHMIT